MIDRQLIQQIGLMKRSAIKFICDNATIAFLLCCIHS